MTIEPSVLEKISDGVQAGWILEGGQLGKPLHIPGTYGQYASVLSDCPADGVVQIEDTENGSDWRDVLRVEGSDLADFSTDGDYIRARYVGPGRASVTIIVRD